MNEQDQARPESKDKRSILLLRNKVFGIGLPRTVTSSLTAALSAMGLRCRHFVPELWPVPSADILKSYDAFIDTPIPALFEYLDKYMS